ncbi:MAG: LCP family protein [Leucobacter sp.]
MSHTPGFDSTLESVDHSERDVREPSPRRRARKKRTGRKIVAIIVVLVLLATVAVIGYVLYLGKTFNDRSTQLGQDQVFSGEQPVATDGDGTNILLLGSDSRDEDVDYEDSRGNRSDTMMVMHLDGDHGAAQIMSIPRDLWVPIEGHGEGKINAAMSHGGLPLATQTVSDFIDAPIHHVAIIDFEGFQALTDSVGGVEVESEQAFESNGHSFSEGTNHVDGEEALSFVRARKNFSDGDLQRGRNQQAFLKALVGKIVSADTLSNPNKVAGIVRDFSPYMTVDGSLTSSKIAGMAYEMRDVRTGDIQFFSAPVGGAGRSADGQAILHVDDESQSELQDAFANDTLDEYAEQSEDAHL